VIQKKGVMDRMPLVRKMCYTLRDMFAIVHQACARILVFAVEIMDIVLLGHSNQAEVYAENLPRINLVMLVVSALETALFVRMRSVPKDLCATNHAENVRRTVSAVVLQIIVQLGIYTVREKCVVLP